MRYQSLMNANIPTDTNGRKTETEPRIRADAEKVILQCEAGADQVLRILTTGLSLAIAMTIGAKALWG